jgi:hypothetical protein
MRNAYRILIRKTDRKRAVGRLGNRWEDNIQMHSKGMGWRRGWKRLIWFIIRARGGLF